MTDNTGLWLSFKRAAFTLGAAPFPNAQSNEIVIRPRAIAVNLRSTSPIPPRCRSAFRRQRARSSSAICSP